MNRPKISIEDQLNTMWQNQVNSVKNVSIGDKKDFKKHIDLPVARIKRIMKSDQDVRMIAAETPVLFARACEIFIMDITIRSSQYGEYDNDRLILTRESIKGAIANIDIFDFLANI
ncbi:hypothetical protein WA158_004984 [Blastocystis sp. Blastoise]